MTHIILTSWIGGDEKFNGDFMGSAAMYSQIVGIWRNMILTYDLTHTHTDIYILNHSTMGLQQDFTNCLMGYNGFTNEEYAVGYSGFVPEDRD